MPTHRWSGTCEPVVVKTRLRTLAAGENIKSLARVSRRPPVLIERCDRVAVDNVIPHVRRGAAQDVDHAVGLLFPDVIHVPAARS